MHPLNTSGSNPVPTKKSLSPAWQALVALCHRLNFGRILDLTVRGGEPILDPPPLAMKGVKFGGDNGPRPEAALPDFPLKAQHLDLIHHARSVGDGVICEITVKHGLPFGGEYPA